MIGLLTRPKTGIGRRTALETNENERKRSRVRMRE